MKWVGGKRQLLTQIKENMPQVYNHYFEPFVGGGAVVFGLCPDGAVINDFNPELTNLYSVVKNNPAGLIAELKSGRYLNEENTYYNIRAWLPESSEEQAARTLYLNHTCFNGLYRVNKSGGFNVPYGKYKNPTIFDESLIMEMSRYLQGVTIMQGDYMAVLDMAQPGDFVYLDPPYAPLTPTSSFTSYIAGGWDDAEQQRLKAACDELTKRGVQFMQSNSSAELIKTLYHDYNLIEVDARRSVAAKTDGRQPVKEVLIKNY